MGTDCKDGARRPRSRDGLPRPRRHLHRAEAEAERHAPTSRWPTRSSPSIDGRPESGEWHVTRHVRCSMMRVPRRATLNAHASAASSRRASTRSRWGIPASMVGRRSTRSRVWNLVTTVDAYRVRRLQRRPRCCRPSIPSTVASTQGTGFGGMMSMRKLFVDRFLGDETTRHDILQEALPNVVAAHTMQSYVGGYGSMINPVGACATAAVSHRGGRSTRSRPRQGRLRRGRRDRRHPAWSPSIGFGSDERDRELGRAATRRGISARFVSRANDRRRGGFVEAQGGGTILLTRGDDRASTWACRSLAVVGFTRRLVQRTARTPRSRPRAWAPWRLARGGARLEARRP